LSLSNPSRFNPSRLAYPLVLVLALLALIFSGSVPAQPEAGGAGREGYSSLADILEDEDARSRLIQELRQLSAAREQGAGTDAPGGARMEQAGEDGPSGQAKEQISLARQIANITQGFAETLVRELTSSWQAISGLATLGTSSGMALDMNALWAGAFNLAMLLLATLAAFFALRRLARPLFAAASAWSLKDAGGSPLLRRTFAVTGAAVVDLLAIILAYVTGYLVALFVLGEPGTMDARESLFLNAFLLIEVFKALIRMLFVSRDDGLRILPMPAEEAAYWNAWLARLSGFIGYGLLLVVPMINFNLTPALGRAVTIAIMVLSFIYALAIIAQNKQRIAEYLQLQSKQASFMFTRVLLGMLSRVWHWIAIVYFLGLVVVTLARPEDALPLMLQATLQTLVAVGGGLFLSVVLTQIISRELRIPEETRVRFPMLEARLNSFIPSTLKTIRLVILILVLTLVLDAWGVFNLGEWLATETGSAMVAAMITVALILIFSIVLWIGMASWIEHRLNPETGSGEPSAREKTLLTIFRNAIAITLIIITLMIVLAEIGINIGPLIAGAGVLGLAIGFGAQKLVQDIITGVFIQLENAINAGDIVTAGGITGTAERLTIRSLGIRDLAGTYHLIPFSSVDTVSNYMREYAFHVGEYGVAYRENIDDVIVRLREAFDDLISDPEQKAIILGELEVHGVTALGDSSVNIRVRIKTLPGVQWAVGREYNRMVKKHFDAAGIEIPFPHMTMYFGQNKDGSAPAAPIKMQPRERLLPAGDAGKSGAKVKGGGAKPNPTKNEDFDDVDT